MPTLLVALPNAASTRSRRLMRCPSLSGLGRIYLQVQLIFREDRRADLRSADLGKAFTEASALEVPASDYRSREYEAGIPLATPMLHRALGDEAAETRHDQLWDELVAERTPPP